VLRAVRLLFWALDAFVAGLFALAWLGRHIRPDGLTWPLQLIAVGFPYLTVAVVALLIAQLLRRNWRSVAVHAVLLAFALARYAGPSAPDAGEAAPSDTLALLTYNVAPFFGDAENKGRDLAAYVARVAPDVVTLQEGGMTLGDHIVRPRRHFSLLYDSLGYSAPLPRRSGAGAAHSHSRVVTLGLPQPLAMRVHTLAREHDDGQFQQFVRTEHELDGQRLALWNVHLRSYGSDKPWSDSTFSVTAPRTWRPFLRQYRASILDRADESDSLRALVEADSLPTVVAGDFNTTMHNWSYSRIAGLGLIDAWRAEGEGWGATYHARAPIARIDFVLVDPRLRAVSADLDPDAGLSDHHPLLVRLVWRDPAGG
jgi:endonuclease/exonuclease/phosphatase family metal-dependent hydrolase